MNKEMRNNVIKRYERRNVIIIPGYKERCLSARKATVQTQTA
jgi:hypothetical protein